MQCKRTFTKRFTHSTQKGIAPFYGKSNKNSLRWQQYQGTVYCIAISSGFFFTKKQIAVVFNKTTIVFILPSKTCQHHLETGTTNV